MTVVDWEALGERPVDHDLGVLGVAPETQSIYRRLLRSGRRVVPLNAEIPGIDRGELAGHICRLEQHGLVYRHGSDLHVVRPHLAVGELVERRLQELNAEVRRVVAAGRIVLDLDRELECGGIGRAESADSQRIEDSREAGESLLDLALGAESEVLAIQAEPALESFRVCLQRGVRLRILARTSALEDPEALESYRQAVRLGAGVRTTGEMLEPATVYDSTVCVVPVDAGKPLSGIMILRQAVIAAHLRTLFAQVWRTAEDLPMDRDVPDTGPSALERAILDVLSRVDKDEIGARELGVSLRTYRRNVACLLRRLGAANRFQAGLLAAERGWL